MSGSFKHDLSGALPEPVPALVPAYLSTKTIDNLPCAHRQWRHPGHCKYVHGYSRTLHFTFGASSLTREGFVVDFSDLKELKRWLESTFDHTLLLNHDDPLLQNPAFMELCREDNPERAFQLVVLDNVGMEGTARHVFDFADAWLRERTNNRSWVVSVECRENNKNSAIYHGGCSGQR
jgi:6-pyruvoyltetrahydropterin/6-carboxytetrahydropterin synthase